MYSGFGRRNEPHADRKYYAIEAIEHAGLPLEIKAAWRDEPPKALTTQ